MASRMTRALLSVVMPKSARDKLSRIADVGKAAPSAPPVTPERAELIRQAMTIYRAKSRILDDIDPALRTKIQALALKKLLNIEPPPEQLSRLVVGSPPVRPPTPPSNPIEPDWANETATPPSPPSVRPTSPAPVEDGPKFTLPPPLPLRSPPRR